MPRSKTDMKSREMTKSQVVLVEGGALDVDATSNAGDARWLAWRAIIARLLRTPEARVAAVLCVCTAACTFRFTYAPGAPGLRQHFGAEYYGVARALLDGRGFSDPFDEPTGPTAWVAPFYPVLIATLLAVFKSKSAAAWAVLFLTNLSIIFTGTTVYALARRCSRVLPAWLCVPFFVAWTYAYSFWFYSLTGDIWLMMLLFTFMTIVVYRYLQLGEMKVWVWGLLGGLAAVISPTLALGWGCWLALFFFRARGERRRWAMAAAIAALAAAPWAVRNAVQFGRFIPVKSNAPYELFQSTVGDTDGLLDAQTFMLHPYVRLEERFLYAQVGEAEYLASKQVVFNRWMATHQLEYLKRLGNRIYCATLKYLPIEQGENQESGIWLRRAIHPLPFLLLIASIWIRGPNQRLLKVFALFYLIYAVSYLPIAYYVRYFMALTSILVLFVMLGADQILWRLRQSRVPRSVS